MTWHNTRGYWLVHDQGNRLVHYDGNSLVHIGGNSTSIAIEGRKPFFYSLYAWKLFSPVMLKDELKKLSPFFRENHKAQNLAAKLTRLDTSGSTQYTQSFLEVFEDVDYQREFSKALDKMVKSYSLVEFIERDIQFLDAVRPDDVSRHHVHYFWNEVRKGYSVDEAIRRIEKKIFNPRIEAKKRLDLMRGLVGLKPMTDLRLAGIFSRILKSDDVDMKHILFYALQLNTGTESFQRALNLMDEAAKHIYLRVLKNLASQPAEQWGGYVKQGQAKVIQLEIELERIHYRRCRDLMTDP